MEHIISCRPGCVSTCETAYDRFYKTPEPPLVIREVDTLIQLLRIVADGDLISKEDRDTLCRMGYVCRAMGFNIITMPGIEYLLKIKRIHP